MSESIFNKDFFNISGERIELRLIDTYEAKSAVSPFIGGISSLSLRMFPLGKSASESGITIIPITTAISAMR